MSDFPKASFSQEPRESKECVLSIADDLEGKFICLQKDWNVACLLRVGELNKQGTVTPIDTIGLNDGDFVEVGAELDFVIHRDRSRQTNLKGFLTCTYMVHLVPKQHIQIEPQNNKRGASPTVERPMKKIHTTIDFDDDGSV
ncbi:uncharacterized protein HD556DRAFT_1443440 [Suillus plorans]|uniref:Uncharacterized protein n=1 Tax=Suillus plorans TaxID=116603 RepID=A0A9P7AQQ3_9AGAM|nr:uncharacterized protein HD556DRAFT_1443440 [Suillus plorans]KAG1793649.1 hypothetical protein HD556DRAFT_1443440 [Suillus plorans]